MTADQERAHWLEWRREGLGASDIPALLGLSTFQSPWSLWADKLDLLPHSEATEAQERGQDLEVFIANRFRKASGLEVAGEQMRCVHPEHSWARATVDGIVIEPTPGANALGVAEWKSDGGLGTWRKEGIPARVQAQVQWQMYVTGMPQAWLGVFHSGFRFEVYELHRDDRDINFMVMRAGEFWERYVLTGTPPPVDDHDATARAIGQVWPEHDPGKTVDLSNLAEIIDERARLKAQIKAAEVELAKAENLIRETFADAETGTLHGRPVLTLRAQERRGLDIKALRQDHPEITQFYETTTTFRVLRPAKRDKAAP